MSARPINPEFVARMHATAANREASAWQRRDALDSIRAHCSGLSRTEFEAAEMEREWALVEHVIAVLGLTAVNLRATGHNDVLGWNGTILDLANQDVEGAIHEICHWLTATPEMRLQPNYGLGGIPERFASWARQLTATAENPRAEEWMTALVSLGIMWALGFTGKRIADCAANNKMLGFAKNWLDQHGQAWIDTDWLAQPERIRDFALSIGGPIRYDGGVGY